MKPTTRLPSLRDQGIRVLAASSASLLAGQIAAGMLALTQGVLLARTLGLYNFGTFGVVVAFVTVTHRLLSFRMNEVVIRYAGSAVADGDRNRAGSVIVLAFVLEATASLVGFALVLAVAHVGARLFADTADATTFIRTYSWILLAGAVSESCIGVLQVFSRFGTQSVLVTVDKAFSLAAVGIVLVSTGDLGDVFLGLAIGSLAYGGLQLWTTIRVVRRHLGAGWWRVSPRETGTRLRTMLSFAVNTNLSGTLSLVTKEGDLLWLGLFRTPAEVAYYKLASSLTQVVLLPTVPLAQTIYPELVRKVSRSEWSTFRRLLRQATGLAAAYVVPITVLVAVVGSRVLKLVYGTEFGPAAPALLLLVAGHGFAQVLSWSRPALLALDRSDYPVKINVLVAVLKIIGMLSLVRTLGYVAAAALLATLYLIGVSACILTVAREVRQRAGSWRQSPTATDEI